MKTLLSPTEPRLIPTLPNQDQLPYDDNENMETQRHKLQMDLLIEGLGTWLAEREDGYVGGNMFVYFSQAQLKNQDFKGPDFFAVTGVSKKERKSWVVWEEEKAPDVIIELLSESTATQDKTVKKTIYQNKMRVSEYFWYDPFKSDDFVGFVLHDGVYQSLAFNEQGWLLSSSLQLVLRRWQGTYQGIEATWLRWADLTGIVLPTNQELAQIAQQQAQVAQAEAQSAQRQAQSAQAEAQSAQQALKEEQQRAEKLANKLRELGLNPDSL
ncbi:MAG: Uma2 family endonuclease [Microcystaceae cyanobacterium]